VLLASDAASLTGLAVRTEVIAMGRLPNSAHETHPWVISQIAPDFKLLDVWALPVEGGPGDFGEFLETMTSIDPVNANTSVSSVLFRIRLRLGKWFGWDAAGQKLPIPGCQETTLRERLPSELSGTAAGFGINPTMQQVAGGFMPVYRTSDEAAAELSNGTVHGVLHLCWVAQGQGRYRAQMGVYVKPRGRLGGTYLKLIEPFRHLIVYPSLMRQIERAWAGHVKPAGRE
jgi:Protein of unknown function (DUF2867)